MSHNQSGLALKGDSSEGNLEIFGFSRSDPRYNLASSLYSPRWEEGVYRLISDGHCHTFNPENVSQSGLKGQHYFNLGFCRDD